MSEDQLDEWIVKNAHDVSIDSEPVWAVFTEDLRGMLNGKVVIDAATLEQSAAEVRALKSELEVLHLEVSRLNAALMAEKSYSTHYETKFHYVSAECADMASSHVGTVGDFMQPQASKEQSDTPINFNQEHKA